MSSSRVVVSLVPLAAIAFAAVFVGMEHFNGGVKTHHFLARADLPGFSNWLSLLILPLLGIIIAWPVKRHSSWPVGWG
jgi:ABC-type sulfate transport system permease subunit